MCQPALQSPKNPMAYPGTTDLMAYLWFHGTKVNSLHRGQLLPVVCNRLHQCCSRIGRHPQGHEIQCTGRSVHLPVYCCKVSRLHELWHPLVSCRPWTEVSHVSGDFFCFDAFLLHYFGLILFCYTTVSSWTGPQISLFTLLTFPKFFPMFHDGLKGKKQKNQ